MRRNRFLVKLVSDWPLHLLMLLPFIWYILFSYAPMFGIAMAFQKYNIVRGIFGSDWIGFDNFTKFINSIYFWRLIRNTFLLGIYSLLFGFSIPIIFALVINELKHSVLKRFTQTISYMPYFISTVVVIGIMYNMLSLNDGVINNILENSGMPRVDFMNEAGWFRPLYVLSGIWQGFGIGAIIYLAAIAGINPEIYEVVDVEGGNRFHKIFYVTLPSIMPLIITIFILSCGSILATDFEKVLLLYKPAFYEVSDVLSTYVYRKGIIEQDFGFAAAAGLFNALINFSLVVIVNFLAKKITNNSLW